MLSALASLDWQLAENVRDALIAAITVQTKNCGPLWTPYAMARDMAHAERSAPRMGRSH